jgi:uncharacterized OsmC-like protein
MSELVSEAVVQVTQAEAYRFVVSFLGNDFEPIVGDEPPPLGKDAGPNPVRILGAAIGNCLAASLTFCLGRRGVKVAHGVSAKITLEVIRNEQKRLRIGRVKVDLVAPADVPTEALEACRGVFEDFCTVTQSVRHGIDVQVGLEKAA